MMPQKEIRKHLIWTVPSGAFREDFVYLIIWYTNGNVIVHGMVTWEPERGFESSCCKNTNSNTKFKVRQIQLHASCQKFRENWWGVRRVSLWNCEAEKPGNQDVFVCSAPNRPLCVSSTVFRTQCIAPQCLHFHLTWLEPLLTLGCAT